MNNELSLRATRYFAEPEERDHKMATADMLPDPELRMSPLARPWHTAADHKMRDCNCCVERPDCMASVLRKGPFALDACEVAARKGRYTSRSVTSHRGAKEYANANNVIAAIKRRRRFCANDIGKDVNMRRSSARDHLVRLEQEGFIRCIGREGRAIMYELVEDA